ncbi:MAG: class I SAM-dependent methyltransferase [Saprospiraceae bacterium]
MENPVSDTWYEDFFKGINCELCEKAYSAEWTGIELDFLINELGLKTGDEVLDMPCGDGRLSIGLAQRGFKATGVDISETFIEGLNKKIKAGDLNIKTILGDILSIELNQVFSGAICMGNSFGYFNIAKMNLFVKKVASALKPGARFIINSGMIAESILPNFSKNKSFTLDDMTLDITNEYHVEESYMVSHLLYTKENEKETHSFKHYVFTLGEVHRLLSDHGLKIIATYNGPSKEIYTLGNPQVYIVAEKE